MKKQKSKIKATIIVTMLMISSALLVLSTSTETTVKAAVPANLLQYEWTQSTADSGQTRFNAGPAPDKPNLLWKFTAPGGVSGSFTAFNGKLFVTRPKLRAIDPFTAEIIWEADFSGTPVKLDDTYMLVGSRCVEIETGKVIWTFSIPGAGMRGGGTYIPEEKMLYAGSSAYNLPDPTQPPTLAWTRDDILSDGGLGTVYGDGRLYGSGLGHEMAINATTGETIWDVELKGSTGYIGCYYMGRWLKASLDGRFYCFDGETGEVLWICDPGTFWGFWCSAMAAAYGKVYMTNMDTHLYAIDVETGNVVWKYKGPGNDYPTWGCVADGKVYWGTGRKEYRDPVTHEPGTDEFACVDAETGQLLWTVPIGMTMGTTGSAIAYGNLYLNEADAGEIWCISSTPIDWPMFHGDAAHTAEGAGPTNLALKWKFQTEGIVISSPSISDGVAYIGSHDKNIYAVDAETGIKIWNFTTEYRVKSSPAVVNGRVYTGADDGNVYCLDATTGTQLWKTPAGGIIDIAQGGGPTIRSSPTVVGARVYVGALDGNLYCLNTANGNVIWTFDAGGPITSTVAVVNNDLYLTVKSPGNGILYKIDAIDAAVKWKLEIPYDARPPKEMPASPTVVDGVVYTPSNGRTYFAINATTAEIIWNYSVTDQAGSMPAYGSMLYAKGKVYFSDFFGLTCLDASNGTKIWSTWLSRELYSSPRYFMGKIYVGMENFVFYVIDAETGEKISFYTDFESNNIWSSPTLYDGKAYIGNHDGNLYCFEEALPKTIIPEDPIEPQYPTVEEIAQKVLDNLPPNPSANDIAQETLNQLPAYPEGPTAEEIAQETVNQLPEYPEAPTVEEICQAIGNTIEYPEPTVVPEYTTIDIVIIVAVVIVAVLVLYTLYTVKKQK